MSHLCCKKTCIRTAAGQACKQAARQSLQTLRGEAVEPEESGATCCQMVMAFYGGMSLLVLSCFSYLTVGILMYFV